MKYSTHHLTRIGAGLVIAGLLVAVRAGAADTSLSRGATDFVKDASDANHAEISMAQLAEQKAQNPEIKNLAQMIANDHQMNENKLEKIAQADGVALPQGLTWSEKRQEGKLDKLTGADFDQQYAKDMLEDHVTDLNKFQKASEKIQDPQVKQYAEDTLPVLQKHLEHAETAAKAVGVDPSTISSITSKAPAIGGTAEPLQRGTGQGSGQP